MLPALILTIITMTALLIKVEEKKYDMKKMIPEKVIQVSILYTNITFTLVMAKLCIYINNKTIKNNKINTFIEIIKYIDLLFVITDLYNVQHKNKVKQLYNGYNNDLLKPYKFFDILKYFFTKIINLLLRLLSYLLYLIQKNTTEQIAFYSKLHIGASLITTTFLLIVSITYHFNDQVLKHKKIYEITSFFY
jgi:hypothetical protein